MDRLRMRWLISSVGILLLATPGFAQTPVGTPTSTFVFDQAAPDLATARAYTYRVYVDAATAGQVVTGVTCVAGPSTGVQTCTMPFPAFTPGTHAVTLTAANQAGESAKSAAFTFTLVAVPGAPANIRIGSGGV
jgi:hypothetical protein